VKRITLAAIVLVLAASCSPAPSHPRTRSAACSAPNVALTYHAPVIYLHHFVYIYGLRNSGSTPCSMSGYPSVTALDRSGSRMKVRVEHLPEWDQLVTVTLRPGQTAGFFLADGSLPKVCGRRPGIFGTFEVAAPGTSQPTSIETPSRGACPGQVVFVSPVQMGLAPPSSV